MLHTVVSGAPDGQTVILGPSLGTTLAAWEPQLPAFERHFKVVRFDHRGHGGSDLVPGPYTISELGTDVLRLVETFSEPVHYVGTSLGGMLGMWLASHAPERVDRLVLLSTSAFLPPASAWHDRAATVRARGTQAVAQTVVARWFTAVFRQQHPDVVAHYTQQLATVPAEGYAACCEAIAAMDLRSEIGAISAPTLVVVGADDPATPPAHAEEIASRIAGARVAQVGSAAHLANVEQPVEIDRLVLEHLGAL